MFSKKNKFSFRNKESEMKNFSNMVKKLFFLLFLIAGVIFTNEIGAQSTAITIANPLTATSFEALIGSTVNFIFYLAIALAPLMIVAGAFFLLTSGGEPNKIKTGKDIITYTFVGLLVVLLAKALTAALKGVLGA